MSILHNPAPIFVERQIAGLFFHFYDHFCIIGTDESTYYDDGSSSSPVSDSQAVVDGYLTSFQNGMLEVVDEYGVAALVPYQRILTIDILAHRSVFGDEE